MTTGAKSGQPREEQAHLLPRWTRSNTVRLIRRRSKNPQWYYNLKAHPECQLGDEKFVATEVTDPDEYARLYGLAERSSRITATIASRRRPLVGISLSFG